MNSIDFLPEAYHQKRIERNIRHRRWVLILLTSLTLAGWGITRHQQSARRATEAHQLELQAQATKLTQSEMDKLRAQRKNLIYQSNIQQQLDQPISDTQVLALIGQLMPDGTDLSRVIIKTHRPEPKPIEDEHEAKKKKKVRTKRETKQEIEAKRDYLSISVHGVAPDDVMVAEFIQILTDHDVFQNVKLHYSRADETEHASTRQFHISAEVLLDRRYVPPTTTAGVLHED